MRLPLFDKSFAVCAALQAAFEGKEGVAVVHSAVEALNGHDVLVAAGNSFSLMDGGIDDAVRQRFPGAEGRVQERIVSEHGGLLAVGATVTVLTGDGSGTEAYWLVYAPTMIVPMDWRQLERLPRHGGRQSWGWHVPTLQVTESHGGSLAQCVAACAT